MTTPDRWKWLFQPLPGPMRRRLELALGVVVTGAAVVGLSSVIRPDPSKLAPASTAVPPALSILERRAEPRLRAEAPPPPKVAPEFGTAVARGDLDAMEKLHTPGMPLDGMLAVAAESGEKAVVVWLLDHGADVHEDEGSLDAPVLVADEHPGVVSLLLERGASEASLATAAHAGAINAVGRLLAAHAAVNPTDASPLYEAVSSTRASAENKKLIVEKLLAAGADPNGPPVARGGDQSSPLTAATRACEPREELEEREERAGAKRGAPGADCTTIIKLLVKRGARAGGDALVAALLLDESVRDATLDAVLTARLEPGATAVALTQAWNVQPRSVKALTAKGVDWAWRDGEDDAALPLLAAVQGGDRDLVRSLLDAGAPANQHFKNGCPLGEALDGLTRGNTAEVARIVELLVARGADVNRRLPDGRTPLFAAAESGELRVVNFLLDHGARPNDAVLDDTALDAAELNGHVPAARVLHARGARRTRRSAVGFP